MTSAKDALLLIIAKDAADTSLLSNICSSFAHQIVDDYPQALKVIAEKSVSALFIALNTPAEETLDFINKANEHIPLAEKILWTDYAHLHEIIGTPLSEKLNRIMSKTTKPQTLERVIAELFTPALIREEDTTFFEQTHVAFDWLNAEKLLRWSTTSACHISGCVIRCLPTDLQAGQMQLVLKQGEAADALLNQLEEHWGAPFKQANEALSLMNKQHPVVKHIGTLWKPQSLYLRQVHDQETYVYLIVLPWEQKPKLTLILGIHSTEIKLPYTQILEKIHQDAFQEVSQFVVPTRIGDLKDMEGPQYVSEYDWVMTHNYLGPDRRSEPTPFLNQYSYTGKRKTVPEVIEQGQGAFVDRMAPWVIYLLVIYIFLSTIDTCFTYWFVSSGDVIELNPVLRPLIKDHPWLFVLVKNIFSLGSFLLVARLQIFRIGKILLPFNLAIYFFLDIYWFILIGPKLLGN
ncbi:MAG: hypothetical protein CMH60_03735 [Myxococcales bacterium]|nr:hypothetical protein [Myxococcales bacterium]